MEKSLEDNFCVAVSPEDGTFALEFLAELDKIENLTVVNNDSIPIFAEDGLVAAGDVEDCEAGCAERHFFALEPGFLIRAAMGDGIDRVVEHAGRQALA
jgi:hypothetical protein